MCYHFWTAQITFSTSLDQSSTLGPSGSLNWQFKCTGPGEGSKVCRTAASMVVSVALAGVELSGAETSMAHLQ